MSAIIYGKEDGIATIKFNRPELLNAINMELATGLLDSLDKADRDEEVKAIILSGAGRAFAAGWDLKEHQEEVRQIRSGELGAAKAVEIGTDILQQFTRVVRNSDKVVIAAAHGYAVGAGFEICIACDLVVAAEDTKFGFPELTAAMTITSGATKLLPMTVGLHKARELAFSGEFIDAQEAYRIGLVSRVVPLGQEEETAKQMARKIMSNAPLVVLYHKRLLNQGPDSGLEATLNNEKWAILACLITEDAVEAVQAFNEKRKPVFKGK